MRAGGAARLPGTNLPRRSLPLADLLKHKTPVSSTETSVDRAPPVGERTVMSDDTGHLDRGEGEGMRRPEARVGDEDGSVHDHEHG